LINSFIIESELCFPHLNSSCRKNSRAPAVSMLIYVILSSMSLLTMVMNLMIIISISHFKKLHSPTNSLLLSLAVSDFLVGFLLVFQIILIDGCWFLGDIMCGIYFVLDYIFTAASIGTMVLISVDRYVAVCYPLHYPIKVTQYRVQVCVFLCWTISVFFHCMLLMDNIQQPGLYNTCVGECVVIIDFFGGIADVVCSFIAPVTVIVVLYVRIFVVAVSQARAMRSQVKGAIGQGFVQRVAAKKSEMKAAKALGVVVLVFLMCVCPYFCVTLESGDAVISASAAAFVMCLFYVNSFLNPLIYAFFYPWFRNCMKCIVTFQILKPGSSDANMG
uniref:G-protein coupled receptors family 1 profile domain-containing protein n=1 Tax=Gouania willdenowi TaxID=441366 RepID=A0A8C5I845_GOUWI